MNKNRELYENTGKKAKNCVIALYKYNCSTSTGISNSGKLNQSVTCKLLHLIVENVSYGLTLLNYRYVLLYKKNTYTRNNYFQLYFSFQSSVSLKNTKQLTSLTHRMLTVFFVPIFVPFLCPQINKDY